ncbi:TPA: GTP-binding protein [Candidatus Taylorbacteria bacterium]|nr:GTP-binding protein [Candidatus Taylorbacteria bacterium]
MDIKSAEFKKGIRGTDDILYEPVPQVAFIGRSNVGKSSLINCLLKSKDLVKSGKTPGKTRELNFFLVNNSIYFVDLPGYGFAKMDLEKREQLAKMIQWYFMEKVYKRKAVLVIDMKIGPTPLDLEMLRILQENEQDILIVANKADVLNQKERSGQMKNLASKLPGMDIVPCSAKTGEGRIEILQRLK